HAPEKIERDAGGNGAGNIKSGTPAPFIGARSGQITDDTAADIVGDVPDAKNGAAFFDAVPVGESARAGAVTHTLGEAVEGPEKDMGVVGAGRAEDKIDSSSKEHASGNVLSGIAAVGEVAHDEFACAIRE